jgi:hypothetical protein
VTWSVRGLDSLTTTAAAIVARVRHRLTPGAIVALHDGTGLGGGRDRAPTLAALTAILRACDARGLRCVALAEAEAPSEARTEVRRDGRIDARNDTRDAARLERIEAGNAVP